MAAAAPATQEQRRQHEAELLSAVSVPLGFEHGRPLAALLIFESCQAWGAFAARRAPVFDRILAVLRGQVESHGGDCGRLVYW